MKKHGTGHQDSFATPSAGTDPAHESSESLPVGAPQSEQCKKGSSLFRGLIGDD